MSWMQLWQRQHSQRQTKVASVRQSATLDREVTQLNQAQARVLSNDGRCYLATSHLSLMLEDPVEPDENVARTLADPLEWNAEMMRALSMLNASVMWSELCAAPWKQRYLELQHWVLQGPFVAPELACQIEGLLRDNGPRQLELPSMDGPGDATTTIAATQAVPDCLCRSPCNAPASRWAAAQVKEHWDRRSAQGCVVWNVAR